MIFFQCIQLERSLSYFMKVDYGSHESDSMMMVVRVLRTSTDKRLPVAYVVGTYGVPTVEYKPLWSGWVASVYTVYT